MHDHQSLCYLIKKDKAYTSKGPLLLDTNANNKGITPERTINIAQAWDYLQLLADVQNSKYVPLISSYHFYKSTNH